MTETIKGWQCIGCGRVEAPQNCIGVCRDRKVELVHASELADAETRLAQAHAEAAALRTLVAQLAGTKPRDGQWEQSYRSMQERAKALLAMHAGAAAVVPEAPEREPAAPEAVGRTREA